MKRFAWMLALFAFVCLSAAAVWMGGLNQDEGWYLYAANLVAEGKLPYRDFFYTQGPLLPVVYSLFTGVWQAFGLLGARIFTLALGVLGIVLAVGLAGRLVDETRRPAAQLMTFLLLAVNLYHLYYLAIPKTYALAGLLVIAGFYLLSFERGWTALAAGLALALSAGARISLGILLPVAGVWLLFSRPWRRTALFALGGAAGLALAYGGFVLDDGALQGLIAAQKYHAARGGFDLVWTVGSFSRLVRWYLPVFIVLGLGIGGLVLRGSGRSPSGARMGAAVPLAGFLAVFAVQMLAPFPYEDYQVPVMSLLAVAATVLFFAHVDFKLGTLLVFGLAFAGSFGSPLLEKWATNGQDRFWSLKKPSTELAQLRKVAAVIEALDPDGKDLLTQDLYLAIETGRKVPKGLEMGPFAMLTDDEWRALLESAPCRIAALSGYTFAIVPPACHERPVEQQMAFMRLLKRHYECVGTEEAFGQNATTLVILRRK